MKKRIEYQELKAMGATRQGLKFYNETDPLEVIQNPDGSYSMTGAYELNGMNKDELLKALDELGHETEV